MGLWLVNDDIAHFYQFLHLNLSVHICINPYLHIKTNRNTHVECVMSPKKAMNSYLLEDILKQHIIFKHYTSIKLHVVVV